MVARRPIRHFSPVKVEPGASNSNSASTQGETLQIGVRECVIGSFNHSSSSERFTVSRKGSQVLGVILVRKIIYYQNKEYVICQKRVRVFHQGFQPTAFIVLRCLEPPMKHEARVFEMTSQTSVRIKWNYFRKIGN